jgi:stearoyl-CoA desaturase (delta-9 desaturase)
MPPRPESRAPPEAPVVESTSASLSPRGTKVLFGEAGAPSKPYVPKDVREHSTPQPGERYVGLLGDNWPGKSLVQKINWLQAPLLILTPIIAFVGCWVWTFNAKTLAFAVLYYFFSGLGITAGGCSCCLLTGRVGGGGQGCTS